MRKIILIQHCQSEHHINNLTGGWTDTPLTDLGRKQANLLGAKLKNEISTEEYTLYSSDLLRAKQTADIIDNYLNLGVIEDFGLREINNGIAAWKTKDWVKENEIPMPEEGFNIDHEAFLGGETWRQFFLRVSKCMEDIYNLNRKNLIIVTHGCALSYIIAWWLKLTPEMLNHTVFSASPASISMLLEGRFNQRVLRILNDTSHLTKLS
ncbi:histidine phosphatase family protein [Clostridium sp. FP2]|uniref:histidine phosphatase family protein n=1 Tax=Clostridium sp. FP2 TaxID=2724481 RepID=UPI0013E98149|nr:histidine phosphatase family protein [Clostridium sp. FP2]MBZ9623760.1 histidine phosphatase family protein [Clostridium sp. FP2]